MVAERKNYKIFIWLGVVLLQYIMAQVVTFLISLILPNMVDFQQSAPVIFILILGLTFSIGVFLVGWMAIKRNWLIKKPRYTLRIFTTLVGSYVPLIIALVLFPKLEPGNPFFFISMILSIVGFHIP